MASSSSSSSGKMSSLTAMCEEFRDKFDVEYVTASEVLKRVRDGGDGVEGRALALVDVRGEEERETSRLPNAMSVEEYEAKRDSMGAHDCVCYCTIGYRSGAFAEKLAKSASPRDADVDVKYYNLYGSILAWTHAGGELVDANGAPTKRVHTFASSGTAPRKGTRACISSTRWRKVSAKCSAVGLDARNSFDLKKSRDTRLVLTMLYNMYKRSFYLHCRREILTPLRVLSRLRSRSFGIRCATDRTPRRRPSPSSRAPMRAHSSFQECL